MTAVTISGELACRGLVVGDGEGEVGGDDVIRSRTVDAEDRDARSVVAGDDVATAGEVAADRVAARLTVVSIGANSSLARSSASNRNNFRLAHADWLASR